MVTGSSDQGEGCFFPRSHWNFFRYHLKENTICDEYIKYWNNGMYVSDQVNASVRDKKAPGTRIRVELHFPLWLRGAGIPRIAVMTLKYTRIMDMWLWVPLPEIMPK